MNAKSCSIKCKNEDKCHLKVGNLRIQGLWSEASPQRRTAYPALSISRFALTIPQNSPKPFYFNSNFSRIKE